MDTQRPSQLHERGDGRLADTALHLAHESAIHVRRQGKLLLREIPRDALLTQYLPEYRRDLFYSHVARRIRLRVRNIIDALVAFGPRVISYIATAAIRVAAQKGVEDMTVNENAEGMPAFHKSLLKCVEDIGALLPGLNRRYELPVIIDAMAEHVGAAVQVLLRKNLCDTRHARLLIKQLEGAAFMDAPEERAKAEAPPAEDPENSNPE